MVKGANRKKKIVNLVHRDCGGKIKMVAVAKNGKMPRLIARCDNCGTSARKPKELLR